MEGFLLIDKPEGLTSHDVVNRIRCFIQPLTSNLQLPRPTDCCRSVGRAKVGHAGTLDPFATGLLIVGVGRGATREMEKLVGLDKTYEAVFVLGARSDTDDKTGKIELVPLPPNLELENVKSKLKHFIGTIDQMPPAYSAIKIGGKKMYEQARKGKPMKAAPRKIIIYDLALQDMSKTNNLIKITLTIHCSSGTYIRALARDLGENLGTGGYVETLRRTAIGMFDIKNAHTLEELEKNVQEALIPISDLLTHL